MDDDFAETLAKEYDRAADRAEKLAALPGIETMTGAEALRWYAETSRDTARTLRAN